MKFNLKAKMILFISVPVILTLVALSSFAYIQASKALTGEIRSSAEYATAYYAKAIHKVLGDKEAVVATLAGELSTSLPADAELRKKVEHLTKTTEGVQDLYVAFPDKRFVDGTGWVPPSDYDATHREWYKKAIATKGTYYTDVYIDAITKKPVLSISRAIRAGEQVIGVVGIDIDLKQVVDIAKQAKAGQTGYAFVLSSKGDYIYHPTLKMEDNVHKIENGAFAQMGTVFLSGKSAFQEFTFRGVDRLYSSTAIGETSWAFVLAIPSDEVYAPISILGKTSLIVSVIALAIIITIIYYTARSIAKPVAEVADAARAIASGDLTVKVSVNGSKDEIGILEESFMTMITSLRQLVQHTANSAQHLAASSEELTASAMQSAQAAGNVAEAISAVAAGADQQVQTVSNTAQDIGQITASIKSIADNSTQVSKLAEETANAGKAGRTSIDRAAQQMKQISVSSSGVQNAVDNVAASFSQIVEMVSTITSIASQTNLLALNAAIEAARAGEQGRGFAVVADEVRKLAEQSEEAARQIGELVRGNEENITSAVRAMAAGVENVQIGSQVMDEAGQSFTQIAALVDQVTNQIKSMAGSIDDVARGSQSVAASVNEIARISKDTAAQTQTVSAATEEQSASAEEIASASNTLVQLAQDLDNQVHKFRL